MASGARTVYLGLDAVDLDVAQQLAAAGRMPNLARLLREGASVETNAPVGFFVSAQWPTIYTGLTPSRHDYLSWDEIAGGTYDYRETDADAIGGTPLWEALSGMGRRVAVLDAPHARLATGLNGIQLVEWGGHDRHRASVSWPPELLAEINDRHGPHPIGCWQSPRSQFSPCDYIFRAAEHRDAGENAELFTALREGHARKRAVSMEVLGRGGWDLYFNVLGEGHCVGHQFWYLHDASHPRHDPAIVARLGGDPVASVYRDLDDTVGAHLDALGPETSVYVHLSHGMQAHHDGTHLLDPVLWRLDEYVSGFRESGAFTRAADRLTGALPNVPRHRAFSAFARARRKIAARFPYDVFGDPIPPPVERRWWSQPNNTVIGSVRLNVFDREPEGRILRSRSRQAACWLASRLLDLVNLDTGEPVVERVLLTDDHYERHEGDAFGDLIVEWNRNAAIERVWSPATGVVQVPYSHWRSGDHHPRGLLVATGPGIAPGRRAERVDVVHVAPTLAASLGVELPDVDGVPVWDLVPEPQRRGEPAVAGLRTIPERMAEPPTVRRWPERYEVTELARQGRALRGLQDAHHDTRNALEQAQRELERLTAIATTSAWLRGVEVESSLLVSVIMPTRNRAERVLEAIASVQAQRYERWELLVVDDGSEDDTFEAVSRLAGSDPRIRPYRIDHGGVAVARNYALDHACGDVIAYLDDDNRFDPDWLHAVVWAFTADESRCVLYGARVVDDVDRHHGRAAGGRPWLQFLEWDRNAVEEFNRVDMNVLAHRPSPARFDALLDYFADWDLVLQLTDSTEPYELPVVAAYYTTDHDTRLTSNMSVELIDLQYEQVRENTARRRYASRSERPIG